MKKNLNLIILAAGKSSRASAPKGTLEYNGKRLLLNHLDEFNKFGGNQVNLILGNHYQEYIQCFPFLNKKKYKNLKIDIIRNNFWDKGPFYSVQLGIEKSLVFDGSFITPVDTFPSNYSKILETIESSYDKDSIIKISYDGKGGHPVLIPTTYFKEILELSEDSEEFRLDYFIKNRNLKILNCLNESILTNLNFI